MRYDLTSIMPLFRAALFDFTARAQLFHVGRDPHGQEDPAVVSFIRYYFPESGTTSGASTKNV